MPQKPRLSLKQYNRALYRQFESQYQRRDRGTVIFLSVVLVILFCGMLYYASRWRALKRANVAKAAEEGRGELACAHCKRKEQHNGSNEQGMTASSAQTLSEQAGTGSPTDAAPRAARPQASRPRSRPPEYNPGEVRDHLANVPGTFRIDARPDAPPSYDEAVQQRAR